MAQYLEDDGIWCQVVRPETAPACRGRPALFLQNAKAILEDVDMAPCRGDGRVDIFDIFAVLDAFQDIGACPQCP